MSCCGLSWATRCGLGFLWALRKDVFPPWLRLQQLHCLLWNCSKWKRSPGLSGETAWTKCIHWTNLNTIFATSLHETSAIESLLLRPWDQTQTSPVKRKCAEILLGFANTLKWEPSPPNTRFRCCLLNRWPVFDRNGLLHECKQVSICGKELDEQKRLWKWQTNQSISTQLSWDQLTWHLLGIRLESLQ